MTLLKQILHVDSLSLIMMALVGFVTVCVASFASRYLKGDRKQPVFYTNMIVMVVSVFIMVSADHLLLMLMTWASSNFFLVRLMLHKQEWLAAKESSSLAFKNFGLGFAFLGCAFLILYKVTGQTSIYAISHLSFETSWVFVSSIFILLAAMTQSALWPFHKWLTSSLNSPTPVSAIMHAGLVNGGGFLLTRFAPMLSDQPTLLSFIFIIGIATALLGTLWKLMQSDIKRMLACSTMGQMGFMIAQCGLGLFPAAIAHLCWHGLFKAYLFLNSGSAAQEKRLDLDYPPSLMHFGLALICGIIGAFMFTVTSDKAFFTANTTLFLTLIALIAGTQFALPIIRDKFAFKLPLAIIATAIMGSIYGLSVYSIEYLLEPMALWNPQPLNINHLIAFGALVIAWLGIIFGRQYLAKATYPDWMLKFYVRMLNASQPHSKTVTAYRNHYQF